MFKLAIAGMFSCAAVLSLMPAPVSADALDLLLTGAENPKNREVLVAVDAPVAHPAIIVDATPIKIIEEESNETYEVKKGDTLISIANQFKIEQWSRIFDKNSDIENPDLLEPGITIEIPRDDEELEARELPAAVVPVVQRPVARSASQPVAVAAVRGSSDGNRYVAGYCTWYVKGRRPDLPNNLGNAATWVSRAAAQGIATGSAPRVGAVGQRGNHVVYVEAVNPDGTVTVSEMNRRRLYEKTTRTEPASYFRYIY